MTTEPKQSIPRDFVETLFRHHLWANERLFAACAALSEEQLAAKINGTYGSIGDTLLHIVRAERSYLHRITTGQPYPRNPDEPPMTVAAMQAAIRASGEGYIAAAPKVSGRDVVEIDWDGTPRQVPCVMLLTQAINHATEHRAEIMTTLTQIGVEPPSLDGWTYFDQQSSGA